jgi:hypothetical protein
MVWAGRPLPSATRLGKASIAAGMVLLAAELAAALAAPAVLSAGMLPVLRTLLELALAGVLVASAVEKLVLLTRTARHSKP